MGTPRELAAEELRKECDPSVFKFNKTDELNVEDKVIGQERAIKAIDFGLNINDEWFNLYVSGIQGTGRNTAILKAVEKIAKEKSIPQDLCYLHNFDKTDEPKSLKVPAGWGCEFRHDMEEFVKDFESEIRKAFLSEDYEKHRKALIDKFEEKKESLGAELEEFVKNKGFVLEQTLTGFVVSPVYKGRRLTSVQYDKLPEDEKGKFKAGQEEVDNKLYENSRKIREFQRELKNETQELDKSVILYAIGHLIDDLKQKYNDFETIAKHLEEIREDILKNADSFKKEPEAGQVPFLGEMALKEQEAILNRYRVNLLVDNCKTKGAPVIAEQNPTYYNLTGHVEYKAQFGVFSTDFTMIKPGSILKANGGYLIVQASQILRDYFAWEALKKVIRYKKVKIENLAEQYGFMPTTGLKPQAIPVNLKVIVVGSPLFYHLLYLYDEDFRKFFKVKIDFDTSIEKSDDFIQYYANFISIKCKEENLLPFDKEAVARIIDHSSRIIAHKEKLTTRFLEVVDIMKEADYWARKDAEKTVGQKHVKLALEEKVYRSNMIEKKIHELFDEGTLFVDTEGKEVGQINALSVINLGDYAFGMPSRITASTFMGKGNIINIEREAKLSGKIHSKGVLILSGYLGEKFAQDKPLALSASICFEQQYEEVEGDSASSTELYCLLSSLSGIALRQDIAVTGSVNQRGKVQPVGGINEKIEGFYEVCKLKGLTEKQGVMMPKANVKHLMLKEEVVEAVRQGKFHIYPVENIEEGIEVLTGVEAGRIQENGKYPEGSVFYKTDERLSQYAKLALNSGKK